MKKARVTHRHTKTALAMGLVLFVASLAASHAFAKVPMSMGSAPHIAVAAECAQQPFGFIRFDA